MAIARYKDLCLDGRDLAGLEALGATVVEPRRHWTVMADPEGGEFCAMTH